MIIVGEFKCITRIQEQLGCGSRYAAMPTAAFCLPRTWLSFVAQSCEAGSRRKVYMAKHAYMRGEPKRRWPKVVGAIALVLFTCALAAAAVVVIVRPDPAIQFLESRNVHVPNLFPQPGRSASSAPSESEASASQSPQVRDAGGAKGFTSLDDRGLSREEAVQKEQNDKLTSQTPLVATCSGVDIHNLVNMVDLTGILFHQASYEYALPLETDLSEADYETIADTRTFFINRDQVAKSGEWAETEALHIWRTSDTTAPDTSIDIGAIAGSTVKAPVDGTVVLVRNYRLYEEMDDVEIHIQPTGRPDLDCVIIHLTDPRVKAGDKVEAGVTPIAQVRDIESFLTDVQLGFFTPEGVGGNHSHVQMNDANYPQYREKKLEGAISV